MYISNRKYRLAELNLHNLQPSSKLLAQVFLTQNKIWATISPTPQEAYQFMLHKTREMLDWQQELRDAATIPKHAFINFVYIDESDNIVAVWTNFELVQYLSKKSKVYLKQFDILEGYGQELQKSIDPNDKVPGKAIYGMFTAIKPELMGIGFVGYLWHDGCHYLQSLGFKMLYGRSSNIKSKVLIVKIGGEMISKLSSYENGKKITLSFVKYELNHQKLKLLQLFLNQKIQAKL